MPCNAFDREREAGPEDHGVAHADRYKAVADFAEALFIKKHTIIQSFI